jgi:hypothetical protein
VTWDAEPLELDSTRTFLGRVYKEWWNQFPLRRRTVKQIEDAPKDSFTGRFVQFVPCRVQIKCQNRFKDDLMASQIDRQTVCYPFLRRNMQTVS